ncbi:MAG TPA: tetraacyldisaccharide 4'-kinase [Thermoanaerobaculia bacterium]|nr:tetraacyldisaccharide 4'-kinase [Thermoanaerobaculia bacterium]
MTKIVELLYRGINRVRRALYRAGILRAKRLPVPVISVGGIAAGGSGKTPATIAIAAALVARGKRVAVLTRGYGRAGAGGVVKELDPARFGDEPVLIKKRVPGAEVIVGKNRYENAIRFPADVFVLDDGFQHLQLHRDIDVVIDHRRGFLREGPRALQFADFVIPRKIQPAIPDSLRGKRVFAFAGLADNRQFFDSLGLELAGTRSFPDHHRYSREDIERVKRDAAGAPVVTTEKDAVKIDDPDIMAIPVEFVIDDLDRILASV